MTTTNHDDLRLTDAYRIRNTRTDAVLSSHPTYKRAQQAAVAELGRSIRDRLAIEELVDGQWVTVS